ncbi:hypothetical protein O97_01473 [Bartonella henselae str. Zeus]|nr:hypothetical protein Q653_01575 [Bartonella henselae JK 42]ETS11052.1 hypothetical protein Q652_01549 [Bartonella henselae JK 41]KEC55860.1 hypothetical protein O97_01473 [Bartonella henselae str. Zeus]KEC58182.1 hypothetical protein O95_01429 [Bartonella henselae JK 53]
MTFTLLIAISFAICSWVGVNANVTINHVSGTTTVSTSPQKVIIFDLASLDNMNRLGIKAIFGVPEGKKSIYLQQFDDAEYEKIGTLFESNYEKIATLQPDLITISLRTQARYKGLSKVAPTIDLTIGNQNSLEYIKWNASILRKFFGKGKENEQEIVKLNEN